MADERGLAKVVKKFLDEASIDVLEERVIAYIVRELHNGRKIAAILDDPYVRNRLNEDKLNEILENSEILEAVQQELNKAFKDWDFKFQE
jgi:hypothetical protein